jgi:hypothetical protein
MRSHVMGRNLDVNKSDLLDMYPAGGTGIPGNKE